MRILSKFRDTLSDLRERVAHDLLVLSGVGTPLSFSAMVRARQTRWRRGKYRPLARLFTSKVEGAELVRNLGFSIPETLHWLPRAEKLRDVELPANYVLKPERGHSSRGVFIMRDGVNQFGGERLDVEALIARASEATDGAYLVEELLTNFDGNPGIPYDYKFFCFGAKVVAIQVIDRNGAEVGEMKRSWSLGPDWRPLPFHLHRSGRSDCGPAPVPPFADEMVAMASAIGAEIGVFMRIDLFATTRGPVFGEFEPFSHRNYTSQANTWLGSFWKGLEGGPVRKTRVPALRPPHLGAQAKGFAVGRDQVTS
ncbi:hypothetical protein L0V05_00845 [Tabrizicola sp. J26]|nr:hypothetical protein [Tabrizicola rongguiensis]